MIDTQHSPHRFLQEQEREWFVRIIRSADFSLYSTLTFNFEVDSQQAHKVFDDEIKRLSSIWGDEIAFILAEEAGCYSGLSKHFRVRRHLHAVLLSHSDVSAQAVEDRWERCVGNAKVEHYNFAQDGIGYILKKRDDEDCDWRISDNLFLFVPGYEGKNKAERQALKRQRLRRSALQAQRAIRKDFLP
jgi:hypothetical protein